MRVVTISPNSKRLLKGLERMHEKDHILNRGSNYFHYFSEKVTPDEC